jgi:hypothetical protein
MKFIVFITLIAAGWYVMRWLRQFEVNRRANSERSGRRTGAASPRQMRATDTIVCSRCGIYVPSDFPTACDRTGCPFPGVG